MRDRLARATTFCGSRKPTSPLGYIALRASETRRGVCQLLSPRRTYVCSFCCACEPSPLSASTRYQGEKPFLGCESNSPQERIKIERASKVAIDEPSTLLERQLSSVTMHLPHRGLLPGSFVRRSAMSGHRAKTHPNDVINIR